MLTLGQDAPDFELRSHKGGTVKLSDFRGKKNVVLAFHPLAFTPVCANQMRGYESDLVSVRKGWRGRSRDQHRCSARESRVGEDTRLDFLRSPERLSSRTARLRRSTAYSGRRGRLLRARDFRHRQGRQNRLVEGVRRYPNCRRTRKCSRNLIGCSKHVRASGTERAAERERNVVS